MNLELPTTTLSPTARRTLPFLKPLVGLTCISLLGCLGIYFGILVPVESRQLQVSATLTQLQQQQVRRIAAKSTQGQLAKVWDRLPVSNEFMELGVTITRLAKSNQVRIPGMQYNKNATKDGLAAKGAISFEAFGAYEAIRTFIYELETSGTYVVIEKLTAERSKKKKDVAFKLRIGTYFKPDSALSVKGTTTP